MKKLAAQNFEDLLQEEAACGRRIARQMQQAGSASGAAQEAASTIQKGSKKKKTFNMQTYKLHALGDYVNTILWFGTTDSYSTQPGELEHWRVKRFYARTNKNNATWQMTKLEQRERWLERTGKKQKIPPVKRRKKARGVVASKSESLPPTPPEFHHYISPSHNNHLHIPTWLAANGGDPAIQFLNDDDPGAYGFLNPDKVIRGAHIIPAFYYGPTEEFPPSLACAEDKNDDWVYYYVNMFVDRDMYMRYTGGGVGHYHVELLQDREDEPEIAIKHEDLTVPVEESAESDTAVELGSDSGPDSDSDSDEEQDEGSDVALDAEDGEVDDDKEGYVAL
ncbi:hypothetical protein C0991_006486 [Blastosporella zonata]|nr:hypothetical protein C0991_006486 [Blastosporella zonata]